MRSSEVAILRRVRVSPAKQQAALDVVNTQASREELGNGAKPTRPLAGEPAELCNIDEVVPVYEYVLRPLHVSPLRQVVAISAEHLYPVVLTVGDEHAPVAVNGEPVRGTELAGAGTGLTP